MSKQIANLRASTGVLSVDDKTGVVSGAAVMTIGTATGWGFTIDTTTLQQVADLITAAPNGVICRFDHPQSPMGGMLGRDVGYVRNPRIDGSTLRADVELADYASSLPALGDVRTYLLKKCASDPTGIGLSAVIEYSPEPVFDYAGNITATVARVSNLMAVDFVDRPAANPNGLLSARVPAESFPRHRAISISVNNQRVK